MPDFLVIPKRKAGLAAFLSLIIPGAGQIYNGQTRKGFIFLLSSWLIIPWLYGIYDAFVSARRINREGIKSAPSLLAFFIITFIVLLVYFSFFFAYQFYSQVDYQGIAVRHNLKKLANALESYRRDKGFYPQDYLELYNTEPRYIDELYCDVEMAQYHYSCVFTMSGYHVKAEPLYKDSQAGLKIYQLKTGGAISVEE